MSLVQSLTPYMSQVPDSDIPIARRAVANFVVFSDYKRFRQIVSQMHPSVRDVFFREVRDAVRNSFDAQKAWRALFWSIKHKCKAHEAIAKFESTPEDVKFLWQSLSAEDRADVREVAEDSDDFHVLSPNDFASLVSKINRHAGQVAYLRLRFVSDNDKSIGLEDLRGELLAHGMQVLRKYEKAGSLKQMENFAKEGINNHAVNLALYYNSEKRAPVRNVTAKCGTCIFCLTGKPQKCKHAVPSFSLTTLSLDNSTLTASSPSLRKSLHSALSSDEDVEADAESTSFVSFMRHGLSKHAARVFDMVMRADTDNKFETWLSRTHNTTIDALVHNPQKLMKLYCSYLQIPVSSVVRDLDKQYQLYRQSA